MWKRVLWYDVTSDKINQVCSVIEKHIKYLKQFITVKDVVINIPQYTLCCFRQLSHHSCHFVKQSSFVNVFSHAVLAAFESRMDSNPAMDIVNLRESQNSPDAISGE